MKQTTIFSITANAITEVLKNLKKQNVTCSYMGLDQDDKILMEVQYNPEDEPLLERLRNYMQVSEQFLNDLNADLEKYIKDQDTRAGILNNIPINKAKVKSESKN